MWLCGRPSALQMWNSRLDSQDLPLSTELGGVLEHHWGWFQNGTKLLNDDQIFYEDSFI